jgi:histidinol-phosphate aminotransferase
MQPLLTQICHDRDTFAAQLTTMGCVVYPSVANFLLVRTPVSAVTVRDALMQAGILIRYFPKPRLSDCIRISIGTAAQHERVLDVLETIFAQHKGQ